MTGTGDQDERARRRAENRWPASSAILVAVALNIVGHGDATSAVRLIAAGLTCALLVPLFIVNPRRLDTETRWSRGTSIALAVVLATANQVNVVAVVIALVDGSSDGPLLLLTALQVWVTNVVAYALLFWELDRGGPVARGTLPRSEFPPADFAFPQDTYGDTAAEVAITSSERANWRPGFVDYLYLSITNTMAFSPTDTMPLSARAKLLMVAESFTGFVLLALVISRAVNILN
ncbi:hypothetical protein [Rathayibacter toxicus]|uniref:DUF1345 domain-containing protein n=1 Tax=Rathayibacter toxicus TaxID=145458 RepID=A0A2S5Y6T9_9MICO|nr:hypothetical protein [Rathayibacter toxicus]PPH23664.1 hypothetical protein C5D17_05195 [Rathayibacter toxicus]PPH57469.1 hypothetical protein C5D30_05215 [Rathayibacter toxicus]PPH59969.1 hypothetical protein C5C93_05245 [Rathayibacter toxicus]PPH87425.1 hypothetical protein C5D31_05245 [Rathayibacter toxicus]PPI15192.1 hypothetical protein C5C51_05195 [Rathayibacter toxicus]